jgi:hypothetical protein
METTLYNMAKMAAAQLSLNSEITVTSANMNVSYTRATADTLSSNMNTTNYTGASNVNIPDLCSLLSGSIDCESSPLLQQVIKNNS